MITEAAEIKPGSPPAGEFTPEQKEYLAGFMAGVAQRSLTPYVGETQAGLITTNPDEGGMNRTELGNVFGTPFSDLCKQERWKQEEHPLDGWDRLLEHAQSNRMPDEENTFRFRNFGLFYVGPTQNSFMLRCRIPAGELTSPQLSGLADLAAEFGNGKAALTTRSNIQIREIAPGHLVSVLTRLQSLGLTSKGAGVDNVRNITASPTAGFDPQELIDTRPFAHALHHYLLNHREFFNLPRKFNVAFEGGGAVETVAETNDLGFMAVSLEGEASGSKLDGGEESPMAAGIYFRAELAGITGHKTLATDSGLLIAPHQVVAVAAAMTRVFNENGDRTDRKKARLKYLIDRWGVPKFLEETQKKLAFPLIKFPLDQCRRRPPSLRHGHLGVYRQRQKGRNYLGVVIPVGMVSAGQMRRLALLAQNYGSGQVRLTPWQNLILPDISDGFLESVKRQLVRLGLHYESTNIAGGLVACTGSQGCKFAATDTKGDAVRLAEYLNQRVRLDQPINIHVTGCPNSCAQHYVGDIGLQGVKVAMGGGLVEGYNLVFGGGTGTEAAIGTEVFKGVSLVELPGLLEKVLNVYLERRENGESFARFTRRHSLKDLQEMFSP